MILSMRYSWLTIVILLFVASCGRKDENRFSKITPKLDSLFADEKDFSGVVLLADEGNVVYHKAFGYRNFETKEKMDTSAVFQVRPMQERFYKLGELMLMEENERTGEINDVTFERYVKAVVLVPLKMTSTDFHSFPEQQMIHNMAWSKEQPDSTEVMVSCTSDLLKFERALHSGKLIDTNQADSLELMGAPDSRGYSTRIIHYNDKNRTVILLSNHPYPGFDDLLKKVTVFFNL